MGDAEALIRSARPSSWSFTLLVGLALLLFTWLPGAPFRPDQFTLPKDVVLGFLGLLCAVQLILKDPAPWDRLVDAPLVLALSWGALLASVVATNTDVAWRAIAGLSAATLLFWFARHIGAAAVGETLYLGICFILGIVAAVVLLEAFGGIEFISEPGRRPGATLGNRNLVARVMCLSLPLLWRQMVVSDQRRIRLLLAGVATMMIAVIVLSRSRGAWIIAAGLVIGLPTASRLLRNSLSTHRWSAATRLWVIATLLGGLLAAFLPNRLGWGLVDLASSGSRVLDYRTGTGQGRVIQAQTTWRMIRGAPLTGVGPGNWPIVYPSYARPGDPSHSPEAIYPAPRIPRGDMLSFTSEFGIPGLVLVLVSVMAVLVRALLMLRSGNHFVRSSGLMVISIGTAAMLLGFVDPVLRLSPSLALVAVLVGLGLADSAGAAPSRSIGKGRQVALTSVVAMFGVGSIWFASSAGRDVAAFRIIRTMENLEDLSRAVSIAPQNVEAKYMLAFVLVAAKRCDLAEAHLVRATHLQPFSGAVARLRGQCSEIRRRQLLPRDLR